MIEVTVRPMNTFMKAFLAVWSFVFGTGTIIGFASYWDTVYIRKGFEANDRLLAHELIHIRQMHRLGKVKFTLKYLQETGKHGYDDNAFEIEARREASIRPLSVIQSFTLIRKQ